MVPRVIALRIERTLRALGDLLASPRATWLVPLSAVLVTATSLGNGIVRGDDSLQLLKARGVLAHGLAARLDLFDFVPGTPDGNAFWSDNGLLPWVAAPNIRLAFLRPMSSLSAFFDYNVLASAPAAMHAESVALYASIVVLLAAAYRRLLPATVAMLAAFLYAISDAHTFPVAWLANRNALFATLFGLAAWIAHDRWRRDGWRPGAVLGPLAFLGGVLSAELGLAAFAYLAAHAATLDPARSKRTRAGALLPYAVIVAVWQVIYRRLGYGARGSGLYLDPVASPWVFARAAPQRLSALLLGQLALPPSDVSAYVPAAARDAIAIVGVLVVLFVAKIIAADVRRDPAIRFFAVGGVLAAVPMLAIVPSDRLLMLVGFGAFGIIAYVIGDLRAVTPSASRSARILRGAWIAIHVFLAPILLALGCLVPRIGGALGERAIAGVRLGPEIAAQTLVLVNVPNVFAFQPILFPPDNVQPRPARLRALAITSNVVDIRRDDEHTLTLEVRQGPKKDNYTSLFRDEAHPIHAGDVFDTPGLHVEVERVDSDGDPVAFRVHFDDALSSPSMRWLAWKGENLVEFELPAIGGVRTVGPS